MQLDGGQVGGLFDKLEVAIRVTKKSAFLVIFLLTIFDNMLKYLYVSQQANINRQ